MFDHIILTFGSKFDSVYLFFEKDKKEKKVDEFEIVDLTMSSVPRKISVLEKRLSAELHRKVIIHYHRDPKMIGGVVIRYRDNKIDGSI